MTTRMNKKSLRIATVFLGAFALGIWIGAGWHASVHGLSDFTEHANFAQCCAGHSDQNTHAQFESPDNHSDCPVCHLGMSAPDVQVSLHVVVAPEPAVECTPLWVNHTARPSLLALPPQTGPPELA